MPGPLPGPMPDPMPGFAAHLPPVGNTTGLAGLQLPATAHWPHRVIVSCAATEACLQLDIHAGLAWFGGHFVGQPVLPGVVQTHWAGLIALELFTREFPVQFQQLLKLKFNSVVVPGQRLQLLLSWQTERQRCTFKYLDQDDKAVSSGTLCFTGEGFASEGFASA